MKTSFELTFVTGNKNKLAEAKAILGNDVSLGQAAMDLEEIQAVELEEVTRHKLIQAYEKVQKPVFCEDTGLYIEQLNGFPGALIKFYLDKIGPDGICRLHGGSPAYGKTVLGYHDGTNMHFFSGKTAGTIPLAPQGEGFGWSTAFVPRIEGEENQKSFAEIPITLKNKISMRSIALRAMLEHLRAS